MEIRNDYLGLLIFHIHDETIHIWLEKYIDELRSSVLLLDLLYYRCL